MRVDPASQHELTPVRAVTHAPDLLRAYAALGRFVSGATTLDRGVLALVMQLAALRADCDWCIDYGRRPERGVDAEKLARVTEYTGSDLFTDAERAALTIADEMVARGRVADETWEAATRHFSEIELVELVGAVAAETFFTRINLALEVEPQGFAAFVQP